MKTQSFIKTISTIAFIAVLGTIAFYYSQRVDRFSHNNVIINKESHGKNEKNRINKLQNILSLEVKDNITNSVKKVVESKPSKNEIINPFQHIPLTRAGLDFEDDPFLPKSRAEQDWLDRHGYPNVMQYKEYQAASDQQLQQAVDAGDELAKTFLNSRKMMEGDKDAEIAMLRDGALGNSFALELASSAIAHDDPVEGYALSRVVDMSGNFAIAQARDLFFPGASSLSITQRTEAENRARAYLQLFKEYRREIEGADATLFDPRPTDGE